MSDRSDSNSPGSRFLWARGGFDLEGWAGAVAFLVVGLLLGSIWSPLFLIGLIGVALSLLATRYATPVTPDQDDQIVAPVSGVIASVETHAYPDELEQAGLAALRIRISSSPISANVIYAPVTSEVSAIMNVPGDQTRILALAADDPGLETATVALRSGDALIGLRVIVAAFGPRLEMSVEEGDSVRIGRAIGKRRLGGWCDLWLPAGADVMIQPGQTVVAGETRLARLVSADDDVVEDGPELETVAGAVENSDDNDDATAAMFERLRREVSNLDDD